MKVKMLGVNSAFAVGEYKEVIPVEKLTELFKLNNVAHYRRYVEKAYFPKFQSNFLIEFNQKGKILDDLYRFVLDFGGDLRHALKRFNLGFKDVDGYYCSHPHADHVGGIEGIALSTFFNPFFTKEKTKWLDNRLITDIVLENPEVPGFAKPDLFVHRNVIEEIWDSAKAGLVTLQGIMRPTLETYFDVHSLVDNTMYEFKDGDRTWKYYTIVSTHVISGTKLMPSYGLFFEDSKGKRVYFPTDSQIMAPPQVETFFKRADVVFVDCETGFRSGVHAHIDDIRKLSSEIKKKMYLYHFDKEPVVDEGEFKGILKTGDELEF